LGGKTLGVTIAAKKAENAMRLDHGAPTGVFDRAHCLGCSGRLAVHYHGCSGGLHADHAHVVGQDIMQFLGGASKGELERVVAALRAGMDPVLAAGESRNIQAEMVGARFVNDDWGRSRERPPIRA
jgi:hypothetical protein